MMAIKGVRGDPVPSGQLEHSERLNGSQNAEYHDDDDGNEDDDEGKSITNRAAKQQLPFVCGSAPHKSHGLRKAVVRWGRTQANKWVVVKIMAPFWVP